MKLCECGIYHEKGFNIYIICNKTNSICPLVRYCANERCLKMSNSYLTCKRRNKNEQEKKESNN